MKYTYCPQCGTKAIQKEIGDEGRMPYCPVCQIPLWETFLTCVICAVVNEKNEIALLRQEYVSKSNYVCVAGVMKPGESAEAAVCREVKEELGLDAEHVEYVRSYPYDKKEMLMLGFKVTVKKREFQTSGEVDSVEWVKLEDALPKLREGSIAWKLVEKVQEQ